MKYILLLMLIICGFSYAGSRERLVPLKSCKEFSGAFDIIENDKFDSGEFYISGEFEFYGNGAQAILTCKDNAASNMLIVAKHAEIDVAKYHFNEVYNELKHLYGAESEKESALFEKFENSTKSPKVKGFDSKNYEKHWQNSNENKLSMNKHGKFYTVVYSYSFR